MRDQNRQFEYDVAFSFHSEDETLAQQLNDKLQDRFRTFLYSERQKELAGKDGEQVFNSVFFEQARFVVVFYRSQWGETPFTRIEQTAIRNRAFTEGFDFTLFIPTETPATVPNWLPKPRLYFGLERFGIDGAAAVIESRIEEMGGQPRDESAVDRAARLQRTFDLDRLKATFQNSEQGVQRATSAYSDLIIQMSKAIDQIKASQSRVDMRLRNFGGIDLVSGLGPAMTLYWRCQYSNTLDGSGLDVELHSSVPRLQGLVPHFEQPRRLRGIKFTFELIAEDVAAFVETVDKREFRPSSLSEYLLRLYMDLAEKHKSRR